MVYSSQSDPRRGGSGSDVVGGAYPAVPLPTVGASSYSSSSPYTYGGGGGGAGGLNGGGSSTNGRLSPSSTNLGLRKRDAVAIFTCLFLLRLAFTPSNTAITGSGGLINFSDASISASMELAFYSPFQSLPPNMGKKRGSLKANVERTARPVPLDADGDGVIESMVVPVFLKRAEVEKEKKMELALEAEKKKRPFARNSGDNIVVDHSQLEGWDDDGSWGLRVLNLKPLHKEAEDTKEGANAGPFAPRSLFLSPLGRGSDSDNNNGQPLPPPKNSQHDSAFYPIKLLSVQIPVQRTRLGEEEKARQRHAKTNSVVPGSYGKNDAIPPKDDPKFAEYDRKRHYFCGRDWHHAAQSCHKHCPGGLSSECGEGETCYADTPCDAHIEPGSDASSSKDGASNDEASATTTMALTKGGTLPGVATVWSDGSVSLHVITADINPSFGGSGDGGHRPKRAKQKGGGGKKPELELRQLWRVYPLDAASEAVDFEELGITFESGAIYGGASSDDSEERFGDNGAILLGGRYTMFAKQQTQPLKVSFHALDAMTGTSLWEIKGDHHSKKAVGGNKDNKVEDGAIPIPIIHTTSSARRRSHLPTMDILDPDLDNENAFIEGDDVMTSEQCMAHFRASVLDGESGALPHEFWDDGEFGSISVGRFDRSKRFGNKKWKALGKKGRQYLLNKSKGGPGGDARFAEGSSAMAGLGGMGQGRTRAAGSKGRGGGGGRGAGGGNAGPGSSWQSDILRRAVPRRLVKQQQYNARHPHMGKPNVVLFHGRDGLAVLSLKNGRPVCHISLMDHSLYADMDGDGVIDIVQVVTSPETTGQPSNSAVQSLIHRLAKEASQYRSQPTVTICHALVTSGLPPREEVFTAPLCLGGPTNPGRPQHLSAAPPLLLEGSLGYGNDVVFAMNNGVIVRYDFNGREIWRKKGGLKDGTPSWNTGHSAAFLGRVQFGTVREAHSSVSASSHRNQHRPGSPVRPILLSGEDGAALISPASGKILFSVVYPQSVASQPLLADLNGDGTDDLLVVSSDAIWGYRIVVETGRSGGFTIVVVTLLIGVALAALVHKTSHLPGQTPKRSTDA
mmetsp:Transcript_916/g.1902  ORF Transcript_916/g.1902 Transcript_916/m.1902 type:complete len:1076 (-) Transcript_916:72-3299(-)